MKSLILVTLSSCLFLANSSNAATAGIYCKIRENNEVKVFNALSERGHFECQGALSEGVACFTGDRAVVISAMNSKTINWPLNWDEEWISKAHYRGIDSIAYTYNDGPNELKRSAYIDRCTQNFFKIPEVGPIVD